MLHFTSQHNWSTDHLKRYRFGDLDLSGHKEACFRVLLFMPGFVSWRDSTSLVLIDQSGVEKRNETIPDLIFYNAGTCTVHAPAVTAEGVKDKCVLVKYWQVHGRDLLGKSTYLNAHYHATNLFRFVMNSFWYQVKYIYSANGIEQKLSLQVFGFVLLLNKTHMPFSWIFLAQNIENASSAIVFQTLFIEDAGTRNYRRMSQLC